MSDAIKVSVNENNLIIVVRKLGDSHYEAFTEPHPIGTGSGVSGKRALEDMIETFHREYYRMKNLDKADALPMTQQGTLALMEQFSEFF
jgi:hypothetical protein